MTEAASPPKASSSGATPIGHAIESMAREPGWLSPARQFYVSLAAACLFGTVVISLSLSFLIQQFIFGETRDLTVAGVELHFRAAFGDDIFRRPLSAKELQDLDQMVRSRFDVYKIVQVKFYSPDGHITYSYKPDLITSFSPEGQMSDKLRRAFGGEVVMTHESLSRADNDRGRDYSDVFEIYVPVRSAGEVVGVAEVYRDTENLLVNVRFMQGFVATTVSLASLVLFFSLREVYQRSTKRIALQSIALRGALKEIEVTYDQTLETLSVALDGRDAETEGHSRRVREYTVAIAREMGIAGPDLEDIARGALLHDIGKMTVPDAILLKPGALSPDEWLEMRKHPVSGYRMLMHIGFLQRALPVILHHHECWDGSGYPAHLFGEQIPVGARIFAVADALDAITSDRPYRKARSFDAAKEEILRHAGRQFDPRAVKAFAVIPIRQFERVAEEVAARRGSEWGILSVSTD